MTENVPQLNTMSKLISIIFLVLFFPVNSFAQNWEDKLSEPQDLKGDIVNKIIDSKVIKSSVHFRSLCSTGSYLEKDSLVLTIIKGYSDNDTIYDIGLITKKCKLDSAFILPTGYYNKKKQTIIIGWMYSEFENECLKFVLKKCKPINQNKLGHKLNYNTVKFWETKEYFFKN